MNTNLNMTLKSLVAAATFVSLSGPLFAGDALQVALTTEATLDRTTIASVGQGEKTVWIQRDYREQISLGVDTITGALIYPHQSVRIQYAVDCSKNTLNMTAWKMYSEAGAQGNLVWADRLEGVLAEYRYTPRSAEERSVAAELCNDSVAAR